MTQWINPSARRACMFGALLAALMGCNEGGNEQTPTESTFDTVTAAPVIDETQVPKEPVVGTVTEVPDTEPKKPETKGGEATPLDVKPDGGATLLNEGIKPVVAKAMRFTEIAPDTTGGATFKSFAQYEYELGNLVAMASTDAVSFTSGTPFITPIKGRVRFPEKLLKQSVTTDPWPIIIFLHGQHNASAPSYQGYDYLAEDLATKGYVVVSIDAKAINADGDFSSQSRAQLVLGTLDRLRQINENGQIDDKSNPGALNVLREKLDFSRIGIMGHSRGGQGISNTILFNKIRRGVTEADLITALQKSPGSFSTAFPKLVGAITPPEVAVPEILATDGTVITPAIEAKAAGIDEAVLKEYNIFYAAGSKDSGKKEPYYNFKAAFMLAPTDFGGNTALNDIPLANLLPTCDGDMRDLEGARVYDHNRFGPTNDTAPRYQIMVHGANHNFYNTVWTQDGDDTPDVSTKWSIPDATPYCRYKRSDDTKSIRLNAEDQRRNGRFIINSFMRYHVGGEMKFAAYWNGTAKLPDTACPSGAGPCDERMVLTVQKDASHSKLIQRFDQADGLSRNALGEAITFSGFDKIPGFDTHNVARCDMTLAAMNAKTWKFSASVCTPKQLKDFEYGGWDNNGLLSIADHAELVWSKPNAAIVEDITGLSAAGTDSLTFRIAVVRPMGQEVLVTLTDSAGKTATVTASDFTDALYNAPTPKKGAIGLRKRTCR